MFRDLVFLIGSITRRFCAWCFVANSCRCVAYVVDYESASPCPHFTLTRESNDGSSWRGSLCKKVKCSQTEATIHHWIYQCATGHCCVCVRVRVCVHNSLSEESGFINTKYHPGCCCAFNGTGASFTSVRALPYCGMHTKSTIQPACAFVHFTFFVLNVLKCFFGLWNEEKKLTV